MGLAELRLGGLRCLPRVQLTLHPRLNLITGDNGSGKTSVLEAIYLLGRGRSFRTRHTETLIAHGAPELRVFGRIEARDHTSRSIGFGYSRLNGLTARIDGNDVGSLAALSELFPVQVVDPGIHRLVEEGPVQRRRWLDWGGFHVEPDFVRPWQGYGRALRQRNAALKTAADPAVWNGELVRLGGVLTAARGRPIAALKPHWRSAPRAPH